MTDRPRDFERERVAIMNTIAESVAEASAEALWEECHEDGIDVEAVASKTRTVIAEAVKHHKQRKLRQARTEYEDRISSLTKKVYRLPDSIHRKRDLVASVLKMKPDLRGLLTAAARDFQSFTDNDIELMLKQLQELGVLDELLKEDDHD